MRRCDECEKEIKSNDYFVDYFGFIMCAECKEVDEKMWEFLSKNKNGDDLNEK